MFAVYNSGQFGGVIISADSNEDALKKYSKWLQEHGYEVIETTEAHVLVRFMASIVRYTVNLIQVI